MSGTLPPGIYMIRHGGSNFATNPLSNGLSIKFLPSAEPLALATQLWQVSAHGILTSMATKTTFVWTIPSSVPGAHVTRNSERYEWIVRADKDADANTYIGTIMTNDCELNFWGINGTSVELQGTPENFRFIPL